ncbi:MAG: hypothetical protein K5634_07725 [Sphaerochaetaceae bacterium]|nr:hypothetical protein [Sphaerochaetaceae bacterium]
MKKAIIPVIFAVAFVALFVSCDADAIQSTALTMSNTGTNIANPDGNRTAVEDTISFANGYMSSSNGTDSTYYTLMISKINEACYSNSGKQRLISGININSSYSHSQLKSNYQAKAAALSTALNSTVSNLVGEGDLEATELFQSMFDLLWEEYTEPVETLLGVNDSTAEYSTYYQVVLNGAVCLLLDTATNCINNGLPSDLQGVLDVLNPIIASVKAIDNLGDLGIFAGIADIINAITE